MIENFSAIPFSLSILKINDTYADCYFLFYIFLESTEFHQVISRFCKYINPILQNRLKPPARVFDWLCRYLS